MMLMMKWYARPLPMTGIREVGREIFDIVKMHFFFKYPSICTLEYLKFKTGRDNDVSSAE